MHHFEYRHGKLYCEDVSIETIALEVGTPFYCYSHATLSRHFHAFDKAFSEVDHLTCFLGEILFQHRHIEAFCLHGSGYGHCLWG